MILTKSLHQVTVLFFLRKKVFKEREISEICKWMSERSNLARCVFEFTIAAITNDHKLGDVKQHTFIVTVLVVRNPKFVGLSLGLKSQGHRDCVPA